MKNMMRAMLASVLALVLSLSGGVAFASVHMKEDGINKGPAATLDLQGGPGDMISGAGEKVISLAKFVQSAAAANAATGVWGIANGFRAEGATADGFEIDFLFGDPTADQSVTVPPTAGAVGTVGLRGATVVITAGASPTLTVPLSVDFIATDTITTDNQDQTITFSSGGSVGQRCTMIFQTDSGGSGDEVITFHTTLTNTEGTLTLANLTAGRYTVVLVSDGTVFNEVSRTAALS